jgi:hypothetical protein
MPCAVCLAAHGMPCGTPDAACHVAHGTPRVDRTPSPKRGAARPAEAERKIRRRRRAAWQRQQGNRAAWDYLPSRITVPRGIRAPCRACSEVRPSGSTITVLLRYLQSRRRRGRG